MLKKPCRGGVRTHASVGCSKGKLGSYQVGAGAGLEPLLLAPLLLAGSYFSVPCSVSLSASEFSAREAEWCRRVLGMGSVFKDFP